MADKDTAPADQNPSAPIKARLIRIMRGNKGYPAAVFKGDTPKKGSKIKIAIGKSLYSGVVHDAEEVDGEVITEFRDGLSPAK